jgi:hypothetical protein
VVVRKTVGDVVQLKEVFWGSQERLKSKEIRLKR